MVNIAKFIARKIKNLSKVYQNYFHRFKTHIFILLFLRNRGTAKKFDVAICACFKNEAKYLREWIEYHKLLGVKHFYLYNNESSDDYLNALRPYLDQPKLVTLIDFPGRGIQYAAYKNCIQKYHASVRWLALIDIDEFICINVDNCGSRRDIDKAALSGLSRWLSHYAKYPALKIWWRQFGSSGVVDGSHGLVIETFEDCEPPEVEQNWTKCIVNLDYFDNLVIDGCHLINSHFKWLYWTFWVPPVDENKKINVGYRGVYRVSINHYVNKSRADYIERKMKNGRADHVVEDGEEYMPLSSFHWVESRCTVKNFQIQRILPELKLALRAHELAEK